VSEQFLYLVFPFSVPFCATGYFAVMALTAKAREIRISAPFTICEQYSSVRASPGQTRVYFQGYSTVKNFVVKFSTYKVHGHCDKLEVLKVDKSRFVVPYVASVTDPRN
jgi:hypothetical protein